MIYTQNKLLVIFIQIKVILVVIRSNPSIHLHVKTPNIFNNKFTINIAIVTYEFIFRNENYFVSLTRKQKCPFMVRKF